VVLGRRVLDVGSGSGACAIAAVKSGAQSVTANDIDPGIMKPRNVKGSCVSRILFWCGYFKNQLTQITFSYKQTILYASFGAFTVGCFKLRSSRL
jgi:predicted RNA methylase